MGKKGRKTRWRRLPIGGPESSVASSSAISSPPAEDGESPSSPEHRITFNEDEYTKITTPRQDVLFKKGYLGRRRANNPSSDAQELHSADSVESGEYFGEETAQYAYMPPPPPTAATGFIDHTSGVLYVNSSAYEVYDPYSGNVTVVVGPAPQYPPQPVLAAMPCQPVPLNPLEWFNPLAPAPAPAPWACPYNNRRKRYSTDSQNCSAQSSESTGPPGSPQEPMDEGAAGVIFPPQPYMYPGYMFGAPVYNMNGVNIQGVVPQQQVPPQQTVTDVNTVINTTTTKRRKKRRRKRRGGQVTDEGSESSCEEPINCDPSAVCSQSGASSDAGQGSCSKTNSDSGINTEPNPDSGSNTPPLMTQMSTSATETFEISTVEDCSSSVQQQKHQEEAEEPEQQISYEIEMEAENEPISSSLSTPEALKHTCESLPSEEGETLQEISSCSELNGENKVNSFATQPDSCNNEEQLQDDVRNVPNLTLTLNIPKDSSFHDDNISKEQKETDFVSSEKTETNEDHCSKTYEHLVRLDNHISSDKLITSSAQMDNSSLSSHEMPSSKLNEDYEDTMQLLKSLTTQTESTNSNEEMSIETTEKMLKNEEKRNGLIIKENVENVTLKSSNVNGAEVVEDDKLTNSIFSDSKIMEAVTTELICNERLESSKVLVSEKENEKLVDVKFKDPVDCAISKPYFEVNFSSSSEEKQAPIPPPRRRRSLYRVAEKVARKVVEEAIDKGIKEVACSRCQQSLPITEAVTRWLQSQGSAVLSPVDSDDDNDDGLHFEEDEGIEEGEGSSTNQKNVDGNPFLAPYHSGSRQRVADTDECGSVVSSAGEWDMYDHDSHTRAICDPATTVDKYYRLGVEDIDEKMAASASHSMIKTAVHIRRAGPFPCGVCCIIQ